MPPAAPAMPSSEPIHPESHPLWRNHWFYIVLGVIVLGVLGYVLFAMMGTGTEPKPQENQPSTTRLPKVWMQQFFNKEVCDDQSVCGDAADPDSDGLTNYDEFKEGTSPINSDSDADGLADGDEIHVYKTEPTLKYTDRRDVVAANNWTDGVQIKNGYDPLTPALAFTESRLAQIAKDIEEFPLNEPTITTLNIRADGTSSEPSSTVAPVAKNVAVTIDGGVLNPVEVTINVGDSIVWLNKDTTVRKIASDPHPSHSALPELLSPDLAANQTYSFKFMTAGTWAYHDHLNPTLKGTVVVK